MKAVIFGINGQDGHYLNQLLSSEGIEVVGVSRSGDFIQGDVGEKDFVAQVIKNSKADYIFHFAANSSTNHNTIFENHAAISTGTLNILESARIHSPSSKIFLSGSALQFRNNGEPIDELTDFHANSAYSVARIQSVYAARYFRERFNLKVYVGYFFNHDSPLRTEKHVNKKIVTAVHKIVSGRQARLELGNIEIQKEFNFAGDIVQAVWKLVNQDSILEAVIGSGVAYTIKDWVEACFKYKNRNWEDYVILKSDYVPEYDILVSNPVLIKSINWRPKVDFDELVEIMMNQ